MGEVFLSSEELEKSEAEKNNRAESSSSLMTKSEVMTRWERFLPRMMMRVLLVEADDSTRQIIAALLRKCSYRGQLFFFFWALLGILGFLSFLCLERLRLFD